MLLKTINIKKRYQKGFTLIELLLVLSVLAILSMIALPSYRQYVADAKQAHVKIDMLRLSAQLESWRSQTLTYSGFVPKNGYDDEVLALLHSPLGSTKNTADYHIQLKTMSNGQASVLGSQLATNWVMLATPAKQQDTAGLYSYALTSAGIQCARSTPIKANEVWLMADCGVGSKAW